LRKKELLILEIIVISIFLFLTPKIKGENELISVTPLTIDALGFDGYTWEETLLQIFYFREV